MFLSDKPRPMIDLYKDNSAPTPTSPSPSLLLPEAATSALADEEHDAANPMKAVPKKRAETWAQEETLCLIALRREVDSFFNTTKSNRHLWDQISSKMRDKGFDRSPTMCTDKWRNLLKEFKKARQQMQQQHTQGKGGSFAKISWYKELDELLKRRNRGGNSASQLKNGTVAMAAMTAAGMSRVDPFLHFGDKSLDDAGIQYGCVDATGRSMLGADGRLEHDGHPLAITAADVVATNSVNPWNWREASTNGGDHQTSLGGRVILVKWGEYTKRIGVDGTAEAIKEAVKSAFGLRTRRAFWLEDEDEVVRSFDRDMPLGTYTLHLDEGITIKVTYDDPTDRMTVCCAEQKTFYTEDDFRDFLLRRGWSGLRELSSFTSVDIVDDLRPGAIYQGLRSLSN